MEVIYIIQRRIRIQYFNRLKNSIDNLKKENILGDKIKIYICGRGLYSINKFVQYLLTN